MTNIVQTPQVQALFDRAAGLGESGGNPRVKAIVRDLVEALARIIEKHDIEESEFWTALKFMQDGVNEFDLIAPGLAIEHFLDLHMDAKDAEAGLTGRGTGEGLPGNLLEHLGWLGEAGFGNVDVLWKDLSVALLCGVRDHLHMPDGGHGHSH